jgi:DUF1680 family protein
MARSRGPSRRQFVRAIGAGTAGAALIGLAPAARGVANPAAPAPQKALPALEVPRIQSAHFHGPLGARAAANVRNWLLQAPGANPAMLQMFRDRDRAPLRDLVPWAGEFAGKYLISAVQAMRLDATDLSLRKHTNAFVTRLIATQSPDGYLGPFPTAEGMTGKGRWDLWGQYHVMLGLLNWSNETGDATAFAAARKCADHFCRTFLDTGKRVLHAGSEEMNESSAHVFALIYQQTGEERYLKLLREIERDWEAPPSGDYVRSALAGKPFYQCPKPRWESLHAVQAIAELYFITGEQKYKDAYERIWWSIVEGDRHNTGGFSSGEAATGNPYDPRPIETCCTVAWTAVTRDMLRLTGDSRAADELELSLWNAVLGAQSPTGRWWTYNTPMDGQRKASAHDIVFQARAGSPELNCCSVNGPRGIGVVSEWAVMTAPDGVALNYYGPCTLTVPHETCGALKIEQETDYPFGNDGKVSITVTPEQSARLNLRLRIPGWSAATTVKVNGAEVSGARAGTYLSLDRDWKAGDRIELELDLSPQVWPGRRESAGKVSLYRGPILLAYDPRFDTFAPSALPAIDWLADVELLDSHTAAPCPMLLAQSKTRGGGTLTLCDFASAGAAGNEYVSWLPADAKPAPFTRENPWRLAARNDADDL